MDKKDFKFLFVFFLIAMILAIGYLNLGIIFPLSGDSQYYEPLALSILRGKGFTIENKAVSQVTPGYPFFLALVYSIFGHNHSAVIIIQFLILALISSTVYCIGKKFLNLPQNLVFLASLTVLIWPYFILYSTLILTEILFTFFLLLSVYLFLIFQKNFSLKSGFLTGFCFALAALIRPVILLLPFWLIFVLFLTTRSNQGKSHLLKMVLVLVVFLISLTPWIIRNYIQFHQFIPLASGLIPILERAYISLDYTQGSQALLLGEANWKTVILARLKNIFLFWNPGAQGDRTELFIKKYPWLNLLFLIYKITFLTILALAFLSLKFAKKKEILLLWATIFYFWAFHTILYPYPRYTLPIIPLVILLAFYTINYFLSQYKLKHSSQ